MKTTERNHVVSSMNLQSFIQSKVEKIQFNKAKTLNSSKSAKNISLGANNNPFKKTEKRHQVRDLKEKTLNSSSFQSSASEQKYASRSTKLTKLEANKNISNEQEQSAHNPEHFLARNQLYQKQKELKLQFERRKKLYGINCEQKIKSSLLIKENGGNGDEEELAEGTKSYKEMYYKKYGKFKVYEDKAKKKSKNYEELMKESIERFNEKFISGLDHNHQRTANKNSSLASQDHSLKSNVTNIAQVEEKIKTLMEKLNLQEEMNVSVETIEELSRIEMMDDAKASEISSSGLFPKVDQDNHFEETENIVISSELKDNDEIEIEETINNTPQEHNTMEVQEEIKDDIHGQQVQDIEIEQIQVAQEVTSNHSGNEIQVQVIVEAKEKDEPCSEVQPQLKEQHVKQIQSQANDCLFNEDIAIASEVQDIAVKIETFKFIDIFCPKVGDGLNPKPQTQVHIEAVIDEDKNNKQSILEQQILPQEPNVLQIPIQVKGEVLESKHQEIIDECSSLECSYDVCLQSFIDLQGNPRQNIEVQVQHFGFCRFLIADSESDTQPQPQQ